jgi:hypothetical protein
MVCICIVKQAVTLAALLLHRLHHSVAKTGKFHVNFYYEIPTKCKKKKKKKDKIKIQD